MGIVENPTPVLSQDFEKEKGNTNRLQMETTKGLIRVHLWGSNTNHAIKTNIWTYNGKQSWHLCPGDAAKMSGTHEPCGCSFRFSHAVTKGKNQIQADTSSLLLSCRCSRWLAWLGNVMFGCLQSSKISHEASLKDFLNCNIKIKCHAYAIQKRKQKKGCSYKCNMSLLRSRLPRTSAL